MHLVESGIHLQLDITQASPASFFSFHVSKPRTKLHSTQCRQTDMSELWPTVNTSRSILVPQGWNSVINIPVFQHASLIVSHSSPWVTQYYLAIFRQTAASVPAVSTSLNSAFRWVSEDITGTGKTESCEILSKWEDHSFGRIRWWLNSKYILHASQKMIQFPLFHSSLLVKNSMFGEY